ncbi:MAG: hypothetical protein FWG12_03815 [Holophagaceae bacterium]|nr:hypothetical protein [Holophagaceae bacterium]
MKLFIYALALSVLPFAVGCDKKAEEPAPVSNQTNQEATPAPEAEAAQAQEPEAEAAQTQEPEGSEPAKTEEKSQADEDKQAQEDK